MSSVRSFGDLARVYTPSQGNQRKNANSQQSATNDVLAVLMQMLAELRQIKTILHETCPYEEGE